MLVQLQYVRAIAALMVVYFHSILQLRNVDAQATLGDFLFGKSGVDLFFVLSGFVMWITTAGRPIGALEFYQRRVRRIVPLYWAATITAAAIALAIPAVLKSTKFELGHVLASLFFIPWINPADPNGAMIAPVIVPGWTLNYEMYFYLVFGALLVLGENLRLLALLTFFLAVFAVCRLLPAEATAAIFYGDAVVFEFVAGVFIGKLYLDGRRIGATPAWALAALSFAAMVVADHLDLADIPRIMPIGIPAALVIYAAVSVDFSRWKEIGWLRYLGDASYSIYITHIFVLAAARVAHGHVPFEWLKNEYLFLIGCLLASTAFGVLVHHLFEARVEAYFRRRRAGAPALAIRQA
ncbi:acyltransferase [Rhizobiaceae bacterium n13]|uniref:Acyltransferase n=1 Tax=Ferirhizobium litorale TaxID=2927786 RepID=A0AAE3TZ98_9HYPH|nr:acyltransferase [Fererhizobium litorale]MDI7860621.1 acyltransferase [Fererhizobium litorale]MDI7920769.1 acyltransferase [Fererhizobium litorale]